MSGIDYAQLCHDTMHVPLVQAAIDPGFINVWTVQESKLHRRYEQYSFKTQRIDVRVEHDISLYHGLIHRTLDLIGESQWKHRDLAAHEDYEHWLIYYTLETHWPGLQRRQGGEPGAAILAVAAEYWRLHHARYQEIAAKAATLAELSWCALNMPTFEMREVRATTPARPIVARAMPAPTPASVSAPVSALEPAPASMAALAEIPAAAPAAEQGPVVESPPESVAAVEAAPELAPEAAPEAIPEPAPQSPPAAVAVAETPAAPASPPVTTAKLEVTPQTPAPVEPAPRPERRVAPPAPPPPQMQSESQPYAPVPQRTPPLALPLPEILANEPIWVVSEFLHLGPSASVASTWTPAQSIWATSEERQAAAPAASVAATKPAPEKRFEGVR